MKTAVEVLEGALELLSGEDSWCQHYLWQMGPDGQDQYCLVGAINQAANGNYLISYGRKDSGWQVALSTLDRLAYEKGYSRVVVGSPVVDLNNAPETSVEDVRLLIKEAIAELEAVDASA